MPRSSRPRLDRQPKISFSEGVSAVSMDTKRSKKRARKWLGQFDVMDFQSAVTRLLTNKRWTVVNQYFSSWQAITSTMEFKTKKNRWVETGGRETFHVDGLASNFIAYHLFRLTVGYSASQATCCHQKAVPSTSVPSIFPTNILRHQSNKTGSAVNPHSTPYLPDRKKDLFISSDLGS